MGQKYRQAKHLTSSGQSWGAFDWILLVFVFAVTVGFYNLFPNNEFFRDEDFALANRNAFYLEALNPISESACFFAEVWRRLFIVGVHSVFYFHGSFPFLPGALIYMVHDLFGLDVDYATLIAPSNLTGAFGGCITYMFCRIVGLKSLNATLLALALAASPIYAGVARGIGTYGWVWTVVSHLIFVVAFTRFVCTPNREPSRGYGLAAASAVVMFTDAIYYLLLSAAFFALMLRNVDKDWRCALRANLRRLIYAWPLSVTVIGITAIHVTAYLAYPYINDRVPAPMFAATGRHDLSIQVPDIASVFATTGLLLGELTLPIWFAAMAVMIGSRRIGDPVLVLPVSLIIGYSILFIFLFDVGSWNSITYQVYLLSPLISIVALSITKLALGRRVSSLICVTVLGSALLGASSFLWSWPTTISKAGFDQPHWGKIRPSLGAKAGGYLVRQYLINCCGRLDLEKIEVSIGRKPGLLEVSGIPEDDPNYSLLAFQAAARAYGGLIGNGVQFAAYGIGKPMVNLNLADDIPKNSLDWCDTPFCLNLRVASKAMAENSRFVLVADDFAVATLQLPAAKISGIESGKIDIKLLNKRFDDVFDTFGDYFPGIISR